ncbi:MAG TPA: hypothetical protein VFY21_06635 [Xanthobacteraceae bacterium]|nr:hypothetical protein [Xanthobacteraceae bacterium]
MNAPNPRNHSFDERNLQGEESHLPAGEPTHYPASPHFGGEPAEQFAPDAPPLYDQGRTEEFGPADVYDPVWTGQGEVEGHSSAVTQADLDRIEEILSSEHFRIQRKRKADFVPPPPPAAKAAKKSNAFGWAAGTFALLVTASAFVAYQTTERVPMLGSTSEPDSAVARVASLFGATQQGDVQEKQAPTIAAPAAPRAPVAPPPTAPAKALLVVTGASADSPDQILLGVSAEGTTSDMNAVVGGLVPGTTLSSGKAWGSTGWILPAAELATTYLRPPPSFNGVMEYSVSLQRPDNSVIDRQTMRLEWTSPTAQQPAPQQQAQSRNISPEEVGAMLKRGEELLMQGDIASARLLLQRAADAQDARAAFALAASYDPIELKRLGVLGAAPDVAKARDWYERAKQYGSREAPKRLELLASQFR